MMDFEEIKKLVKLLERSNLGLIEINANDKKVRLVKRDYHQSVSPSVTQNRIAEQREISPQDNTTEEIANIFIQRSPLVGIVHLAPAFDAPPYVQLGAIIKKKQPLCYIEAMRLKSEIVAEVNGRIMGILVKESQIVEYDTPLFKIEKIE